MGAGRRYEYWRGRNDRPCEINQGYARFVLSVPGGSVWELLLEDGRCREMAGAARTAASAIAHLRPIVLRLLPSNAHVIFRRSISTGRHWDQKSMRAHRISLPSSMLETQFAPEAQVVMSFAFEKLLLNGIAHVFDAAHGQNNRQDWLVAAAADGRHVSRYPETNALEDFAESVLAWLAAGTDVTRPESQRRLPAGRSDRLEATMRNRPGWFDRQAAAATPSDLGPLFHGFGFADAK